MVDLEKSGILRKIIENGQRFSRKADVLEALKHGTPHPNSVRCAVNRRGEARNLPAPIAVNLSEGAKAKEAAVRAHKLGSCDTIQRTGDE